MSSSSSAPREVSLDAIVAAARARVKKPRRAMAEALARAYMFGITDDDSACVPAAQRAGAVVSLLELAQHREPGQAIVRVWNPPAEPEGPHSEHTVIELVNDDMPFLVDSVVSVLSDRDLEIHQVVHPQVAVARDDGRLESLFDPTTPAAEGLRVESLMHIEINQQGGAGVQRQIQERLLETLGDVRAAVEGFEPMRARVAEIARGLRCAPRDGEGEAAVLAANFLDWLLADHFTLLGCCDDRLDVSQGRRRLAPVRSSALGILAYSDLRRSKAAPEHFLAGPQVLRIAKSSRRATVHRPVHMDLIAIKWLGEDGKVLGERRLLGLFTSRAYSDAVGDIPLLDQKVERVLERADFLPGSHDFKALRGVLERYPRDELFQTSEDDLLRFARRILSLQLRPRTALMVRFDAAGRYASCMVFVPRDRHDTEQRRRIHALLEEAFEGTVTAFSTRLSDQPLAQLQFIVRLSGHQRRALDLKALEARIAAVSRSWSDELKRALVTRLGEEAGLGEWRRYGNAFKVTYQAQTEALSEALADLAVIDGVLSTGRLGIRLYRRPQAPADCLSIRTFELGAPAPLARYLPVFEHMGLETRSEIPYQVCPEDGANCVWVRAFELSSTGSVDVEEMAERFEDAFSRIWTGEVEDDPFNRLVIDAGLSWRQVVVLRAYARYLKQVGLGFSPAYTAQTLARHPQVTNALLELFQAQFDPARQNDEAAAEVAGLRADLRRQLDAVQRVDEDRILRRFLRLVENSLRTNYYQSTEAGNAKGYLSIKLDTEAIPGLPSPCPRYEVFVYASRFEAVHLRGGAVARGGIRWSDRREDYRTEILGLVKAQRVKNAVIVPVGAKGGFVLTRPPAGRDALLAEAKDCYRSMMQGLLDITDNYQGGRLVTPPDVVRRDGDDPYLVVAADKGTATFSDLANGVAAAYGFWLGDAFASGGSAGYDHKRMGITARGAWESVKEHFRDLGVDVGGQDFTAVGVGDMSGDVFGNAMLLSPHLRLLGAFNHLHILVDPDPDPALALAERRRLFALPRSSWDAYDKSKLSPGGAVFDRQEKQLEVSPQVRQRFALASTRVTPAELMRAILGLDVDLLWFGGIGTFVKAKVESNMQVGDRGNDELRLNAEQIRARVIGEGANLGVTQAARVAFACQGGKINTDFIDNAGGVDCSDHEVNIKIALADAVGGKRMTLAERNALLESMTDDVAALVLRDNRHQVRALSMLEARSAELADEHQALMRDLERTAGLDRVLEGLPDDASLKERTGGLTRPELAVLLAYAKIATCHAVLACDLPEHPRLTNDLVGYFPRPMRTRLDAEIKRHRLRREIIATQIASDLVNRVGPSFVSRNAQASGHPPADVVRAFLAAREIFDAPALWRSIETLDGTIPLRAQLAMGREVVMLLERGTRWLLRHHQDLDLGVCVETFASDLRLLASNIESYLPARSREHLRRRTQKLRKQGAPEPLAAQVAALPVLPSGFDVVGVSRAADAVVERVALVYFQLGERFAFDRLQRAAAKLKVLDRWQRQALADALEELHVQQAVLTRRVVEASDAKPRQAIRRWIDAHRGPVAHFDGLIDDAAPRKKADTILITVLAQELRRLAQGQT